MKKLGGKGRAAVLALVLALGLPASAAPGDLDSSFGGDGVRVHDLNSGDPYFEQANDIALQGRKILSAIADGSDGLTAARFRANGARDPDFGTNGVVRLPLGVTSRAQTIATQGRKILVGGFAEFAGNNRFAIARFRPGGAPDGEFGAGGYVVTPFGPGDAQINEIKVLGNDKIVAAGWTTVGAGNDIAIARYGPNGGLDPSFSDDGKRTIDDRARDMALDLDLQRGRLVLTGISSGAAVGQPQFMLTVRLRSGGALDDSFSGDGIKQINVPISNDEDATAAVVTNRKIVVGGHSGGTSPDFTLARLDRAGRLDETFGGDGFVVVRMGSGNSSIRDLATHDGKILATGSATRAATSTDFALVRLKKSGRPDRSFGNRGRAFGDAGGADGLQSLVVDRLGRYVAGGTTEEVNVVLMRFLD